MFPFCTIPTAAGPLLAAGAGVVVLPLCCDAVGALQASEGRCEHSSQKLRRRKKPSTENMVA